jgi:hypothetical protein
MDNGGVTPRIHTLRLTVELPEDDPAACLEQRSGLACPPESQEQREAGVALPHLTERLKQATSRSCSGREAAPMASGPARMRPRSSAVPAHPTPLQPRLNGAR